MIVVLSSNALQVNVTVTNYNFQVTCSVTCYSVQNDEVM